MFDGYRKFIPSLTAALAFGTMFPVAASALHHIDAFHQFPVPPVHETSTTLAEVIAAGAAAAAAAARSRASRRGFDDRTEREEGRAIMAVASKYAPVHAQQLMVDRAIRKAIAAKSPILTLAPER